MAKALSRRYARFHPKNHRSCEGWASRGKSAGDQSVFLSTGALRAVVALDGRHLRAVAKRRRIEAGAGGDRRLGNAESVVVTASRPLAPGIRRRPVPFSGGQRSAKELG